MRDCHNKNLYLGIFSFACLFMSVCGCYGYVDFVFTCMGVHKCVHGHMGVRMNSHVGCVFRPGLGVRHCLPCLFTLNALSVSGLSALLTKLSSGAFAFPLLELSHALLDMINEIPLNQEPNRILFSLSHTMGKVAKRLGMTLYTN